MHVLSQLYVSCFSLFVETSLVAVAMTSIVDSEAQFDPRLEQVRVPVARRQALKNSGVNTTSALAYAYGQPGQQIVAGVFHSCVRQLEPGVKIGGVSALKRLLSESQTQLLAILKGHYQP